MESQMQKNEIKIPPLERTRRRRLTPAGQVAIVLFFLICAWLGYYIAQSIMDPLVPKDEKYPIVENSKKILNILLLGVDQRTNEPTRADTIVLVSLDLDENKVHLLSIPRDTRVEIPSKGEGQKINHARAYGGPSLIVDTVEKFLDVPVHYYIETNFTGFERIIDVLGGITLNVECKMYFPEEGIDLVAGLQKLKGHDALSYVRWRGDGRGDIGRIERQQKFFQALSNQALRFSTIWKIPDLLDEVNKQVKTDLSVAKMLTLANKFKDYKNLELNAVMVPGDAETINGGSYWIADKKALKKIIDEIYEGTGNGVPDTGE